jgi:hypothetical protein
MQKIIRFIYFMTEILRVSKARGHKIHSSIGICITLFFFCSAFLGTFLGGLSAQHIGFQWTAACMAGIELGQVRSKGNLQFIYIYTYFLLNPVDLHSIDLWIGQKDEEGTFDENREEITKILIVNNFHFDKW